MALYDFTELKSDMGVTRTKSLFYELSYDKPDHVLFTIKEQDVELPNGRTAVALSKIFIEMTVADPTEFNFAQAVFGSWDIWEKLTKTHRLKDEIVKWRKEATIRRKAIAFQSLVAEVQEGGKASFGAAKYLIEEPWSTKDARTRDGRAARKDARETASEAFERAAINDDLKRLKDEGLIQ